MADETETTFSGNPMLAMIDVCQAAATARGRLCACLDATAIGRLRRLAGDLRLARGGTIFAEGTPSDGVFGLRQGVAMTFRRLPDGRRQVLDFLYPGDLFGFAGDDGRHPASAVALTRASLCRIPLAAARDDAELARRFDRAALRALEGAHRGLLRLGRMTATERVADLLHECWLRSGQPDLLRLPMKARDIADHLGLRPETVSRAFAHLRHHGLIGAVECGAVTVHDGDGLRRTSGLPARTGESMRIVNGNPDALI